MAKPVRRKSSLDAAAETIGASLGHLAARLDSWNKQRAQLAGDITRLMNSARGYLGHLGHQDDGEYVAPPRPPRNKGGRPKGYKMSAATRAKLRAAWKRRKGEKPGGRH